MQLSVVILMLSITSTFAGNKQGTIDDLEKYKAKEREAAIPDTEAYAFRDELNHLRKTGTEDDMTNYNDVHHYLGNAFTVLICYIVILESALWLWYVPMHKASRNDNKLNESTELTDPTLTPPGWTFGSTVSNTPHKQATAETSSMGSGVLPQKSPRKH